MHSEQNMIPKEHVLEIFLVEAENVVNSCPPTYLPVTADQDVPLTPNNNLKGIANVPDLPGDDGHTPYRCGTRKP